MLKQSLTVLFILLNLIIFISGCSEEYEIIPDKQPESGGIIEGGGTYQRGENITLIAKPEEGYEFIKWTLNGKKVATGNQYNFIVEEQINPVAVFALQEYKVKINLNPEAGGTVTGEGTYEHGETARLKAKPAEGYQFKQWSLNGNMKFSDNEFPLVIKQDKELTAEFSRHFKLNLQSNIDTENLKGAGTYEYGNEVEVAAPDTDKYRFIKWLDGDQIVSEENHYRFTIETDRELTAVRELNLDLSGLIKTDNLTGHLLPVLNHSKGTVKLINTEGETVVKESEYIQKVDQFMEYGPRGSLHARYTKAGKNEPLVLALSYKGGQVTAVYNHRGKLLTAIPGDRHFVYNQHGYIDYQDNHFGFRDHRGNLVLEHEYDLILLDWLRLNLRSSKAGTNEEYLIIIKDGYEGVANSRDGSILIKPEYKSIKRESLIGDNDIFKAEKNEVFYIYNKNGKLLFKLDYDDVKRPAEARIAIKKDNKWGFIGSDGRIVIEPIYEKAENFFNGYSKVKQGGKWGLIDKAGNITVEPQFEKLTLRLWGTPPDNALALFQKNNTIGFLDSNGEIMFKGPIENFKLSSEHTGTEVQYSILNTLGNYLIYTEEGKYGIKSITGEVVKKPVFEDFKLSRLGGNLHDHINSQFAGVKLASDYTAFKKEGYWAYFKDGEFVTDFIFSEIRDLDPPVKADGLVQLIVKEEDTEGLYDLTNNRYIVPPGKYNQVNYMRNERIRVIEDGKIGLIDKNNHEIIIPGSYEFTGTHNQNLFEIRKEGKYGLIDINGEYVIDPVYDWITPPVNEVIMALKNGNLTFIDLEGQHVVEALEVDTEMSRPHSIPGIDMSYFIDPQLFIILGNGYFDQNGWIRIPNIVNPN